MLRFPHGYHALSKLDHVLTESKAKQSKHTKTNTRRRTPSRQPRKHNSNTTCSPRLTSFPGWVTPLFPERARGRDRETEREREIKQKLIHKRKRERWCKSQVQVLLGWSGHSLPAPIQRGCVTDVASQLYQLRLRSFPRYPACEAHVFGSRLSYLQRCRG